MAPREEDLIDEEPPAIEPYTVLGIEKTATADEVKAAYRKAALKHHPDKAPEHLKTEAHTKFQEVAFAYAVLSNPTHRKRYDATGSTSESVDFDGINWADFYRGQFADVITSESIARFSKNYKGSDGEKDDVLNAYKKYKGKWHRIYGTVMLSDPLEDEERFRKYIDEGIEKGDLKPYKPYIEESKESREDRMKAAQRESEEAMEYAEKLGVKDKLFGKGKGGKANSGEDSLAALIHKRQADRGNFFDHLEAKYGAEEKKPKGKKGRKRGSEDETEDGGMPSEEAFQAAAARLKKGGNGVEVAGERKSKRAKR